MFIKNKLVDIKSYVDWVKTNPDITGHSTYFEAYLSKIERENEQKKIGDY